MHEKQGKNAINKKSHFWRECSNVTPTATATIGFLDPTCGGMHKQNGAVVGAAAAVVVLVVVVGVVVVLPPPTHSQTVTPQGDR